MSSIQTSSLPTAPSADGHDNKNSVLLANQAHSSSESAFKRWFNSVKVTIRSRGSQSSPQSVVPADTCRLTPLCIPPKIYVSEPTPAPGSRFYDDDYDDVFDFSTCGGDAPSSKDKLAVRTTD